MSKWLELFLKVGVNKYTFNNLRWALMHKQIFKMKLWLSFNTELIGRNKYGNPENINIYHTSHFNILNHEYTCVWACVCCYNYVGEKHLVYWVGDSWEKSCKSV